MRLLVARCEVLYTGRLTARLPEAVRLLMFKADGSFLVHDDAGGFRPLNWIGSAFRLRRTRAQYSFCRSAYAATCGSSVAKPNAGGSITVSERRSRATSAANSETTAPYEWPQR
jgi:RecB family endonuclease NucS